MPPGITRIAIYAMTVGERPDQAGSSGPVLRSQKLDISRPNCHQRALSAKVWPFHGRIERAGVVPPV